MTRERAEAIERGAVDLPARMLLAALAALLSLLLLIPWQAWAQDTAGDGEYVRGEIVFLGTPAEVPTGLGLVARRHYARARLTTLAARVGDEPRLVEFLRSRGFQVDLNRIARASFVPNDPLYAHQWHFGNIQGEQAWNVTDGSGVVVAVLDTGLRAGGPDGIGCVLPGYDFVNDDGNPHDDEGHGTHVSGTVAQATNNGIAMAGMAPGSCIMPVKVLNGSGSGSFSDIAEGMHWAVDNGADVINMSLGTDANVNVRNNLVMDEALDYAYNNNVVVVCAAGNESVSQRVAYPAIYPTTIAVGATDVVNDLAPYSNRGDGLDIVAPGGDTTSGVDLNNDGYRDGVLQETYLNGAWGNWFYQGTSMATPHVAGVAALLLSHSPGLAPDDVYNVLTTTALDLGAGGFDATFGYGLVQAFDALAAGGCIDIDEDGLCSYEDNCPSVANPGQIDGDGDGDGDACDVCPSDPGNDLDGDDLCADSDNCPGVFNPGQEDDDLDGIGDACDVPEGIIDLARTGQDLCFNTSGNQVLCGGTGQDGDTAAGVPWPEPRFTEPGGGIPVTGLVVADQLTGLMWLRDANCIKTTHPEADVDKKRDGKVRWTTAHDIVAGINAGIYPNCGGGYNDWRVPNLNELLSLTNAGVTSGSSWLAGSGFTNVASKGGYWSSTTVASSTGKAWYVNLKSGQAASTKKKKQVYLLPVRGQTTQPGALRSTGQSTGYYPGDDGSVGSGIGAASPRFFDNGDTTFTDSLTGLVWPAGGTAAGPAVCSPGGKKNWDTSLAFVACLNSMNYLGHGDWRVPNLLEIRSLMNYGVSSTANWLLGSGFSNVPGGPLWTSTTNLSSKSQARTVNAKTGSVGSAKKIAKKKKKVKTYVWPVRGGLP